MSRSYMSIQIKTFYDPATATFTHVVWDAATQDAAIIDSVLDYDMYSGVSKTYSADAVIAYVQHHKLNIQWIVDTHIHADHITASHYLKEKLGGRIGIGSKIKDVLNFWVPIFNTSHDTPLDGSQFDHLFEDGDTFMLGTIEVRVIHTPGHTPACVCYVVEDAAFVGDTLFMPDVGTARTDFPKGSAGDLYDSIQKILSLPDETRLFLCHDYPPLNRDITWMTTVGDEKAHNILIHSGISRDEYISLRNKRDKGKAVPKLLLPSIQANMRTGTFGTAESNAIQYVKIPLNQF